MGPCVGLALHKHAAARQDFALNSLYAQSRKGTIIDCQHLHPIAELATAHVIQCTLGCIFGTNREFAVKGSSGLGLTLLDGRLISGRAVGAGVAVVLGGLHKAPIAATAPIPIVVVVIVVVSAAAAAAAAVVVVVVVGVGIV